MTLGEVVVALWILGMAILTTFSSIQTALLEFAMTESRSQAMYLCQSQLEMDSRYVSLGEPVIEQSMALVNGIQYSLHTTVESSSDHLFTIIVVVSYEVNNHNQSLTAETDAATS